MTYVVAGVTGNTGTVVANSLLAHGEPVRVVVRDANKGDAWRSRGAEVAVADLGDARALTAALRGARGAYLLVPPAHVPDFRAYQKQVAEALTSAVRGSEVPHVVLLSSIAAQHPSGTGPITGLHIAERLLGDVPRTVVSSVRAGYFMENLTSSFSALEQGVLPSFLPATLAIPMVATADIGRTAATLLLEPPSASQIVELAAPPVTFNDVADALTRILGTTIRVQEAPLDAVVPTLVGFGMTEDLALIFREFFAALTSGHVRFEGTHRSVTAPTRIEAFLRDHLSR